jgi:hypothetical protein
MGRVTMQLGLTFKYQENGRWARLLARVAEELPESLADLADLTAVAVKSGLDAHRTTGRNVKGWIDSATQLSHVVRMGELYWIGVGHIPTLDAATPMPPGRVVDPEVIHGYWFNNEFGREDPANRAAGVWELQENPETILPIANLRAQSPTAMGRGQELGPPKGQRATGFGRRGMHGAHAIRHGYFVVATMYRQVLDEQFRQLMASMPFMKERTVK